MEPQAAAQVARAPPVPPGVWNARPLASWPPSKASAAPAIPTGAAVPTAGVSASTVVTAPELVVPARSWRQQQLVQETLLDGTCSTAWTVDAARLKGNDKVIVSPAFRLPSHGCATFKMVITPETPATAKGASFKRTQGMGSLKLKCENELPVSCVVTPIVRAVGRDIDASKAHDFAQCPVCVCWDVCNFSGLVDEVSSTFDVVLEVQPASGE